MRYQHSPTQMTKVTHTHTLPNAGDDVELLELVNIAGVNAKSWSHPETGFGSFFQI